VRSRQAILFRIWKMFQHERHIRVETVQTTQECRIVKFALSRPDLVKMNGQLGVKKDILRVAGSNMRAQFGKALLWSLAPADTSS
jgi:hypothetical protein